MPNAQTTLTNGLGLDNLAKRRGKSNVAPMRLAFCLAHARRKFIDVVKLSGSSEALSILARIAEVYRIEAKIRDENDDTRLRARRREAAPIMRELKVQLTELVGVDIDVGVVQE
jgi:transposase